MFIYFCSIQNKTKFLDNLSCHYLLPILNESEIQTFNSNRRSFNDVFCVCLQGGTGFAAANEHLAGVKARPVMQA